MNFKLWIESKEPQTGVNVNDRHHPFTDLILDGLKTVETRNSRSLDSVVGKRVGLIRTGLGKALLVGYMTIGEPIFYKSPKEFDADYKRHLVGKDSPFYIGSGGKWGYPIYDPQRLEKPRLVTSIGMVTRKI